MFTSTVSVLLGLTAAALLMHGIGMWATWRFDRRDRRRRSSWRESRALPPLTLLKPVKGLEDELEANLRSFYEQDYPAPRQIVFASTEADEPAFLVAARVAADFPEIETRFVRSRDDFGWNPKVSNMHGALLAARHELVLQSDANVRLPPGHLRRIVGELEATRASLLGCLVVGAGERSPGATLENLQLTAFTAPGLCMAKELANITCILGKAMLFSKQDLEDVGGLERVKDVLAEDFVLAQAFAQAGKRVVLSTATVTNVNVGTSLDRFLARHSRWMKMRAVISVPGMAGDLGSNPLPFALGALFASSFDLRVLAVVVAVWLYKSAWDHRLLLLLRGHGMGRSQLWASPARDLALTLVWAYSVFSRTTEWRGRRFRLGRGSTLTPLPAAGTGSADQQATATATESPR